jgi:regulator of sigma E protease
MTALVFIIVFGMLVFIHEFGHFITAKMNGVTVHEFALGMGPKLVSKQGKETLYSLRVLPIGGYVRMEGEDEASENPGSFSIKSPWQRLSVIAAGPIMNFVLAIVVITALFMLDGFPTNTIGELVEGAPAIEAGLLPGDEIVAINNTEIGTWDDVVTGISDAESDRLEVEVIRSGIVEKFVITATQEEESGRRIIGIKPAFEKDLFLSIKYAFMGVFYTVQAILQYLGSLLVGQGDFSQVSGPVGIYNAVSQASQSGLKSVLNITGLLSINLGLINLLPFPALDGGRIIFIALEILRGKPIDQEKEGFVHFVGFVILMTLMVLLVMKDLNIGG